MSAKGKPTAPEPKSRQLKIAGKPDDSRDRLIAKAAAGPHMAAAGIVTDFGRTTWGELSLTDLVHVLKEQTDKAGAGDLGHAEAMETLATIKSPPVVFAKQANIAHGPQQVNNDTASIARASEIEKAPNELLEAEEHGRGLDTGTTRAADAGHQELATVEAVHRAAHGQGQGKPQP